MVRLLVFAALATVVTLGSGGEVLLLSLDGSINPASKDYVLRGLGGAAGAELVVIQLDTPGGLDSSMKDIVEAILDSEVPVVVWVGPPGARAASAGTFILLAADVA
ncbi:TPA: nodulation protein NfeD, partial [Candidatus Bipolaricaulota bacterium]|nr:nodulation protein NfeD [Candidatus Bipolaricaulota bacterium]